MTMAFTIRVYGLLIHKGHVLVSDEMIKGQRITKFPGGGLEYGEGLKDCLIREIREEIGVEAQDLQHSYTTDFFQQSAFHSTPMQVVSVYYTFRVADPGAIPVVQILSPDLSGLGIRRCSAGCASIRVGRRTCPYPLTGWCGVCCAGCDQRKIRGSVIGCARRLPCRVGEHCA